LGPAGRAASRPTPSGSSGRVRWCACAAVSSVAPLCACSGGSADVGAEHAGLALPTSSFGSPGLQVGGGRGLLSLSLPFLTPAAPAPRDSAGADFFGTPPPTRINWIAAIVVRSEGSVARARRIHHRFAGAAGAGRDGRRPGPAAA